MIWLLLAACYSGDIDLDKGFPRSETWPLDDDLDEEIPVHTDEPEGPIQVDTGDLDPGDIGAI